MPIEDFLQKEINRLAQVLAALIRALRNNEMDEMESIELVENVFTKEFGISRAQVLSCSKDSFIEFLNEDLNLANVLLFPFSNVLYNWAFHYSLQEKSLRDNLFQKILIIYDFLDKSSDYSYERYIMRNKIENELKTA